MKRFVQFTSILFLTCSLSLFAQVDTNLITQFQAGTSASAAEVNQNIQVLIDAIDANTLAITSNTLAITSNTVAISSNTAAISSNDIEIQSLQQDVSSILAAMNITEPTLEQNLSGSIFRATNVEYGIGGNSNRTNLSEVAMRQQFIYGGNTKYTLNTNGTLTVNSEFFERESSLLVNSGFDAQDPENPFPLIIDVDIVTTNFDDAGWSTMSGTWSVDGQVLTFDYDDEEVDYYVSEDGNTLLPLTGPLTIDANDPNSMIFVEVGSAVRTYKP